MMPEGPEVRTLVDQLQPAVGMRLTDLRFLSGRYVRHGRPKGFDDFRKTMTPFDKSNVGVSKRKSSNGDDMVDGHDTDEGDMLARALTTRDEIDVVTEWKAKGKFIYMILDDGNPSAVASGGESDYLRSIWITLGMSGKFVSETANSAANYMHEYGSSAEDGARWYLDFWDPSSERTKRIYYHDTRNFGTLRFSLSESELIKKLATLGLDILDPRTTVEGFLAVMGRTKPSVNICKFLMDQKKISGVGNYILAEGLYRSNIDPFACISELTEQQKRTLFDEIQATAQLSYASQGVTRLKGGSYRTPDGEMGKFQFSLQCYGQEKCPRGRPVIRETEGPHGRTIWYVEDQLFVPRDMRGPKGEILDKSSSGIQEGKKPKIGKDVANLLGGSGSNSYVSSETDTQRTEVAVENLADGITDPAWKEALSKFTSSATFTDLTDFVESERSSGVEIYPPQNEVFSALNLCPLDKVKVVIVGQDPYHKPNQGHGLAFSVKPGVRPPPSLQNIFREAMDDVGIEQPKYGYLVSWATQGVLLLNTVLTVRRGQANSHARRGWEQFTDEIISTLNEKEGLVFLLWGGPAQKKAASVDATKHTIIKTSHPSPLGASKTRSPFLGSKCFSRANKALIDHGKDPIDWSVV